MAEALGDGSGDVANQPEHHLQGSTGHSRIGIISVMCSGRVLKKERNPQRDGPQRSPAVLPGPQRRRVLRPQRQRLRAYLGHPHGHQDVASVLLHSFLHDDERVIFINHN
jgi:hypothetical protein